MKHYRIVAQETVTMRYRVKAETPEEAREMFENGEIVDGGCEVDTGVESFQVYETDASDNLKDPHPIFYVGSSLYPVH